MRTREAADAMPRRVPMPVVRPALDLCKPTGITLDADSRVVMMLDQGGVGKALAGRLEKRDVTVLPLEPDIATDELVQEQSEVIKRREAHTGRGPLSAWCGRWKRRGSPSRKPTSSPA